MPMPVPVPMQLLVSLSQSGDGLSEGRRAGGERMLNERLAIGPSFMASSGTLYPRRFV